MQNSKIKKTNQRHSNTYNAYVAWKPKLSEEEAKKLISKFMKFYPALGILQAKSRRDDADTYNEKLH